MNNELKPGITLELTEEVTSDKTASAIGSGMLPVYATPAMIALMENAACNSVADYLEDGQGTVGTSMNVQHVSATAEDRQVRAVATLTEVDGRRLVFDVEAFDDAGLIGKGTHERFIITNEKFLAKAKNK